ncbi:IS110 family transposase [Streptomyces flaveolus]|uniref:IS110 family transposase n=1 Tax=Streptomyces flaveolus TaxID=67297 RepID=UPI000671E4EE|nr:IS110 family transposase [Streptomyces antibioticus]KMS70019.1 transposase [Streptomyces regensis]KOG69218.1 transposase [Streptomyces antibioticus]
MTAVTVRARGSDLTEIVIGVDTHKDIHVVVVLSLLGTVLASRSFATTAAGCRSLLTWARTLGRVTRAGVEGTGSYGAGLARSLHAAGVEVIEVNRPNRAMRRRRGKSDTVDAEAAARAVLGGEATVVPKRGDGPVEAIRILKIAKDSAAKARVQAINQLRAVLVNSEPAVREPLEKLALPRLVARCATLRHDGPGPAETAVADTLGRLARRIQFLEVEISDARRQLTDLVQRTSPGLLQVNGIGADSAAALLIAAGDNPERLKSEASFAALCGTSPVEASSGKTRRRRLNRGGNRQANAALFRAVLSRMRWEPATQKYVQRRTADGLSKREIIRCLKRYLARTIYKILRSPCPQPAHP